MLGGFFLSFGLGGDTAMIERHGEDATIQAAMRVDELLAAGDLDGARVWRRIITAIVDLWRSEPDEGEAAH